MLSNEADAKHEPPEEEEEEEEERVETPDSDKTPRACHFEGEILGTRKSWKPSWKSLRDKGARRKRTDAKP